MPFQVKRVYDSPHGNDGLRILVDRLWPRGLTKQDAAIDQWLRACAPSDELRKWFGVWNRILRDLKLTLSIYGD